MMHQNVVILADLGARLRLERERLGANQEQFGKFGGVTRNSQAAYERGERKPDTDYLRGIAEKGADLTYVLFGERSRSRLSEAQSAVADLLPLLNEADQSAILHIVRGLARGAPGSQRLHSPARSFQGEND